jgi:hypothetical protein
MAAGAPKVEEGLRTGSSIRDLHGSRPSVNRSPPWTNRALPVTRDETRAPQFACLARATPLSASWTCRSLIAEKLDRLSARVLRDGATDASACNRRNVADKVETELVIERRANRGRRNYQK